jgi:predicted unusual protein kinase regulating ubiquinone biosynthesis (AarF/ABC1/UbiB family)
MAGWVKYGLQSPRFLERQTRDGRYDSLPRSTRFRLALEERGGLFALFGQFLAGRADLLPSPYLLQLRKIRVQNVPPALTRLRERFPDLRVLRTAAAGEVCTAEYRGQPIVIEFFGPRRAGVPDKGAWEVFRRDIRALDGGTERAVADEVVLAQFTEWLVLEHDVARKRTILSNLENLPPGDTWRFPRLIPELQSPEWLAYEATEGVSLIDDLRPDSPSAAKSLQLLTQGIMEQSLMFSLVDAEMFPENFVRCSDGRLGFRCIPAWAPLPVEWNYELLQYMASTVGGNSARALHMLARISAGQDPYAAEQHLMRELSGLQPELKINVVTPESVTSFENCWRALGNTRMKSPLFLDLFHRQWTILGQLNGELAPGSDLVAESLWPVMGRILRFRLSEAATLDRMDEWARGGALLFLNTARQISATLEQLRDNDLAFLLERQEYASDDRRSRRTGSVIRSGIALAVLLPALYMSFQGSGTYQIAAATVAVLAAIALSLFVARIE